MDLTQAPPSTQGRQGRQRLAAAHHRPQPDPGPVVPLHHYPGSIRLGRLRVDPGPRAGGRGLRRPAGRAGPPARRPTPTLMLRSSNSVCS
jgi:hypothetical protein